MRRYPIEILMVLVASLPSARAQTTVADSGVRIRVTTVGDPRARNGTLISLTPDTLIYRPEFLLSLNRTPMDSVSAIEKSRGIHRSTRSMLKGAGVGGLVGLGASAAILAIPSNGDGPNSAVVAIVIAPLLVAGGMVAGGLIASGNRIESWSPLYPDIADASMIVAPARHNGFSFGLSVPYDVPMSIEDIPPASAGESVEH